MKNIYNIARDLRIKAVWEGEEYRYNLQVLKQFSFWPSVWVTVAYTYKSMHTNFEVMKNFLIHEWERNLKLKTVKQAEEPFKF